MQKIISWNVASVRARMPLLSEFLRSEKPDIMLLQEIKATDENFPFFELQMEGYSAVISGQKGYNGVAILSRLPLKNIQGNLVGFEDQARFIQAETTTGVVVICVYVPNGNPPEKDLTDKSRLRYKIDWMAGLKRQIEILKAAGKEIILGGDFNVIERDMDVYNPEVFRESALMIAGVRRAYAEMMTGNLANMIRKFNLYPGTYSFWDFQGGAWPRNNGILLDAIWVTSGIEKRVKDSKIYKELRAASGTSDHVPISILLEDIL